MRPITALAAQLGVSADHVLPFGRDKAKLTPDAWAGAGRNGKLILVTATNPTPAGEGKTTTSIGLVQALERLGESVCGALREPSLGPCFGVKGGGTGGGRSILVPTADINLHFTGDFHAITAAHNLIAALLDNHLHFRKSPRVDPTAVVWPRVLDQNDRALRHVMVGLRGEGVAREASFDITAASEVMAMLCLASDADDLRARIGRTVVAWSDAGEPITAGDLGATGSAMALLRDALLPNLVQTVEGAPVLVHGGPFANIAHGCNSVIATRAALHLADWVVTEAGFAADLGAEKFFDIKCRTAGLDPAAVVIVTTVRAMKYHGGTSLEDLPKPDPAAVERGLANLAHHLDLIARFGKPAVVAINGRKEDAAEEVAVIRAFCASRNVRVAASTHYADGGAGALELARAVMDACQEPSRPFAPLYELGERPVEKIRKIARSAYGARDVVLAKGVATTLQGFAKRGWGNLPICMAKTPASLSDDPSLRGRPTGFDVTVQDVRVNTGAGFLVALLGDINRMPGLPKEPAAGAIDLVDGRIVGVG